MTVAPANCVERKCKHWRAWKQVDPDDERSIANVCLAYPNGIPDDIAFGKALHKTVREDQDNEIVFEKGDWKKEREKEG